MKEKIKQWIRKNGNNVILFLIIAFFSDIIYTISTTLELKSISTFNKTTEIVFSSFVGLIGIWATGYFILIQLYKNSYPMEVIEKAFQKKTKLVLTFSIAILIVGLVTLTYFDDWLSQLYYYSLFIIFTICIFVYTYKINKDLTINTYIEKYFKQLRKSFENQNITEKEVKSIFKGFYLFFDDCAMKEEYYVCNNISQKIGGLFESLIKNCNEMLINGKEKVASFIFERIVKAGIHQIEVAQTCNSVNLLPLIFIQQEKNIEYCIKIGRFQWFKDYIQSFTAISVNSKENERTMEYIWELYDNVGNALIISENIDIRENWLRFLIEELFEYNMSMKYINKDLNLKYYSHFIVSLIVCNTDENVYSILYDNFRKFTYHVFSINDDSTDFVINYIFLAHHILEKDKKDMARDLIDIIYMPGILTLNNDRWNEFVFYFMNATMKKWNDEFGASNRKHIVEMIIELSILKNGKNYYSLLPDYKKMILDNRKDNANLKSNCEEIETIIRKIIINGDLRLFYKILNIIKETASCLKREDKMAQESLFKVILNTLNKSVGLDNKKFLELSLLIIDETIETIDSGKNISSDFGNYIISEIANTVLYKHYVDEESTSNIILLLSEFDDKENGYIFVRGDNQKKKLLYKYIYNIGVNCVENNMEKALRKVSNALGWKIIHSIEDGNASHVNYLIDRTIDLYKIAVNMKISQKTVIFILTLFTTVGTFCLKKPAYNKFLSKIVDFLHKESNTESIKTAIELRTKENDIWNNLFEGKTQELTLEFLKRINNK